MVTFDSISPLQDFHVEVVVQGEVKKFDVREVDSITVVKNFNDIFKNYGPIKTRVICTSGFKPKLK